MTTSQPMAFDAEKESLVLDAVARFVEREIKPVAQRLEHADEWPVGIVAGMREMGLFGCIIREEYGGLGLSASTYAKVVERIARVWMSVSGIINSHLIMAACVQRNGTEAQRQRFLPLFARGELRGGLALTEPDCGTDLQAVRTVARRDGDHYVINGTKTWISNGIHGQAFAVLVKTDPQAQPRHLGMSLFICEKGPGFTSTRKLEKLGYKGIDSAELVFDNFRVPGTNLVGKENEGVKIVMSGLDLERALVAALCVGICERALELGVEYARTRVQFGKPIGSFQMVQAMLAEMYTETEAMKTLVWRTLAEVNDLEVGSGGRGAAHKITAASILYAGEACNRILNHAVQIHGGSGYIWESEINRLFRCIKILEIGAGTSEVRKMIIAEELLRN